MTSFAVPRPLDRGDPVTAFGCGRPVLDDWLAQRSIKNEATGASRTFVSIERDSGLIAGFYSVSTSSLSIADSPGRLRRNMPSPIPVVLIGRLAVDERFGGRGVGASLLADALVRCIAAARSVGIRAVIVDPLDATAAQFYSRFGFEAMPHSPDAPMFLLIADAEATIAALSP